ILATFDHFHLWRDGDKIEIHHFLSRDEVAGPKLSTQAARDKSTKCRGGPLLEVADGGRVVQQLDTVSLDLDDDRYANAIGRRIKFHVHVGHLPNSHALHPDFGP